MKEEEKTVTMHELRSMDALFITPKIAAEFLRCDPQLIRVQARQDPDALGFPVTRIGSRVKIPRVAFIRFLEGELCGEK